VALPWLNKVKAVLEMWWPGDEGGWATAKLLLGQSNPSGHLPITWAKRLEDYPATDPAHPERSEKGVNGLTTFSEGLLVGYRWFDAQHIEPLFPFGYGLSYTQFSLSEFSVTRDSDGGATASVEVRNTGSVAGDAVPQVYLDAPSQPIEGISFAPRTLAGFDRVTLAPGESKAVSIRLAPRAFQHWSIKDSKWDTTTGIRTLHAGFSSRDLSVEAPIQ
ncbi:MAG TPA: glycoside hydrolase family 3 C-terminal domain-containing protein, partial [Silvibacterium sp.]|nr:glycoside hydrolase family 3 C-terminal domain-containing protein [Silvibacterium sp.]